MLNVGSFARSIIATAIVFNLTAALALAQVPASSGAANGTVKVTVVDSLAQPVAGASATLQGPTPERRVSNASGELVFDKLLAGLYTLTLNKAGFNSDTATNIVVADQQIVVAKVALQPSSFTSITEIGRVSTSSNAGITINTSTASTSNISASEIIKQGQLQITQVLNQTPGVSTQTSFGLVPNPGNQAGIPSLRAALPYETSILIDGHPVAVGTTGTYDLASLVPFVLQDIEVVKGPGAAVPTINNAIGGSINFRTLSPTQKPQQSIDYGLDNEVGQFINLKATGTLGRLGYAFDYNSTGSPGPYRNLQTPVNPLFYGLINGKLFAQPPYSTVPGLPGYAASSKDASTLVGCCIPVNSAYQLRAQLAKLRYNIGQQTTLTVSYLGGHTFEDSSGGNLDLYPAIFTPAAGFTGGGPYAIGGDSSGFQSGQLSPQTQFTNSNLFQGELATAIGPVTLLSRYYSGFNTFGKYVGNPSGQQNFNLLLYGSEYIGPGSGTLTYFNGTPVVYTSLLGSYTQSTDKFGGYSVEADLPVGPNAYTVSYDSVSTKSYAYRNTAFSIPAGSGQQQQTLRARADFALSPKVKLILSDYLISYTDHSTVNNGLTFNDFTHSFNGVRLGTTWQPNRDLSVRLGAGSSIAPPYLSLVTSGTAVPVANSNGNPTYFTQTANAPDLKPETAFGYDFGVDKRLGRDTLLSADVYFTHLQNQFLVSQMQSGTYSAAVLPNGPVFTLPLYLTTAANLGNSIYEGLELSIKRAPVRGFGFTLQGSLQRGYAYHIPAGFYNTTAGTNTTNLGVLPNVNFSGGGPGYNGLAFADIPYSQGYGEANYRGGNIDYRLGLTYFGNHNSYNVPAFTVLSASIRAKLSRTLTAQLAGDNLAANHADGYLQNYEGGVPVPLVNGLLGTTTSTQYGPEIVRLSLTYSFGSH